MTSANNPHNLQRFVDAQNGVFEQVCAELRVGQKQGHWMWFNFLSFEGWEIVRQQFISQSLPGMKPRCI